MTESKRTVNLFCPALSEVVQLVARDDQKIDLGSIARTFGLDPATVKLNGHFISRGVDLIASSVTWKSLISFFASRGFSTGVNGSAALVVDGKLSKSGSKRAHDLVDVIPNTRPQLAGSNSSKKTKFEKLDVDTGNGSLKRKQEDANSPMKKLKVDESGLQIREGTCSEIVSETRKACGFLGVNMKRMRDDEMVIPASCKKCR